MKYQIKDLVDQNKINKILKHLFYTLYISRLNLGIYNNK